MTQDFDVVSLPETNYPEIGDTAPDFVRPLVNADFWEDVALSKLTDERPVLLVFYPMDWSPTAINLWKDLFDRAWDEMFNITIVGISISTPYDHKRFLNERGLNFKLFSDPTNVLAETYDIVHDIDGMSTISEPRPAVFLLNSNQTVEYVWVAEEWPAYPDYQEIKEAIGHL